MFLVDIAPGVDLLGHTMNPCLDLTHRPKVSPTGYFSCHTQGLPWWLSGKESAYHCRRRRSHKFDPRVRKILWRKAWQPTPVFLPGKSHGQRSLKGYSSWSSIESHVTEQLNTQATMYENLMF